MTSVSIAVNPAHNPENTTQAARAASSDVMSLSPADQAVDQGQEAT